MKIGKSMDGLLKLKSKIDKIKLWIFVYNNYNKKAFRLSGKLEQNLKILLFYGVGEKIPLLVCI
jgi:hypothetical protein